LKTFQTFESTKPPKILADTRGFAYLTIKYVKCMKKIVCILFFSFGFQSAHADAEAIRRNNCWGFLSYIYNASGYIYSMNPFTVKKDIEEFRV
jgi:hypothetical protein